MIRVLSTLLSKIRCCRLYLFCFLVVFTAFKGFSQTTTVTTLSPAGPYCAGTIVNVTYTITGTFPAGNTFTVQLSDGAGSFSSPTNISPAVSSTTGGTIAATIPQSTIGGTGYKIQVGSVNSISQTASSAFIINVPALSAPTGLATNCAGATFNITNNIFGSCSFFSGNTFTVQLSDAAGSFLSPTNISLAISATAGGTISVTLPLTATTSPSYKIQVVSTNPAVTSPASAAFTINGFGISTPTITGGATSFCQGQNISIGYTIANTCTFPNTPSNNVFTAQLSDASGSFTSATSIGTITSNNNGTISANIGNPPAGTGYRIRVVSSNPGTGVVSPDNGTNLTIAASSGNPSVFGTSGWNAYVYNSSTIGGFTNYTGSYSFSGLNFNTATQYGTTSSPSTATGYAGCSTVGNTYYGISFKQTNFTCGYYQLDVPFQDDQLAVYVNGSMVFQNLAYTPSAQTNVWSGFLNSSSTVELRFVNNAGPGQLQINLYNAPSPLTVSPNIVQCSTPSIPATLTVSSSLTLSYAWTPTTGLTPSSGLGASVTAAPTTTTTYTVTGTDAATSCTVTGTVKVTVSNATPVITLTETPSTTICSGITTSTLSASGASTYSWSPSAGLSATTGSTVVASPTSTTTYTATGSNGCTNGTGTATITVQNVPSSPPTTQFGNGLWDVYCYNSTTLTNYYGYYTISPVSFNTTSYWNNNNGPSVANATYLGCTFPGTNYSESFKRTNFTCGYYQIDVNYQDDGLTLLINGTQVFQNNNYTTTVQTNVWTGFLGPTSTVEFRHVNNAGPGQLQITISPSTSSPQTLSPAATICAGTNTGLTATASSYPSATYAWSVSPTDPSITFTPSATVSSPFFQTTAATPATTYTVTNTMTDAGNTNCTTTATVVITVNPLPTTAVTPVNPSTYCPSVGTVLTATGANTYTWSPTTNLSAGSGYQVTATPTVTTTYTVTGSNNCSTNSASTTITVLPLPAIATFPTGTWNVYGFNSTTIGTNYQGFYTENGSGTSGYDFNTTTRWASGAAPSTANATNGNAWQGCTMNATNISLSFKRTGFACGVYQINVNFQDDGCTLLINGAQVFKNPAYTPGLQSNIWTGVLSSASTVEWQLVQNGGGSGLQVQFVPIAQPASTSVWTGAVSTDWFNASNWCSAVPTSTIDALIPAAGPQNMPAIGTTGANVRTITINGAVAASGNSSAIAAASLTTSSANNLNVYGNWVNNGIYTANSGTISFVGTNSGNTIANASSTTFYNVVLNKTNPITNSSGILQVSNNVAFTSGVLTQSASLQILNLATVSGASNTSYVDGTITKVGNQAFVFPVGNGGYYSPISISAPASASDSFTAQYFYASANGSYPLAQIAATLDHVSAAEYWILNRTGGSSNVSVTLSWNTPRSGGVGNLSSLHVARWDASSSKWVDQGTNGSPTGTTSAGTVTSVGAVNTFSTPNSPFTLGTTDNLNTLPIQLSNFSCLLQPTGVVKLVWTTQSELNNDYFEIERSADGVSFATIGSVKGAGTTSTIHNYSFNDQTPVSGRSYYRLVQTDFDGNHTSSEVCSIEDDLVLPQVTVYPNPASNSVSVKYQNIGAVSTILLLNSIGQEVPISAVISEQSIQVNTSQQPSGLYFIELVTDKGTLKYKLILAK